MRSYSLTYERWCARDGLMQQTARAIDDLNLGENLTARNRNVLFPNAPLLRFAEGFDALTYAFYSAEQNTPHEAAGYLLCTMVQLGGLIYTAIVVGIALIMLSFFTCFNWVFGVFYDTARVVGAAGGNARKRGNYIAAGVSRRARNSVLSRKGRKRFIADQNRKANVRRGLDERGFKKDADGNLVDGLSKWERRRNDYRETRLARYEAGKDRGAVGLVGGGLTAAGRVTKRYTAFEQAVAANTSKGARIAGGALRAQVATLARRRARVDPTVGPPPVGPPPVGATSATSAAPMAVLANALPPQAMAVAISARRRAQAATGTWMRGLMSVHRAVVGERPTPKRADARGGGYEQTTTSSSSERGSGSDSDHSDHSDRDDPDEHDVYAPLSADDLRVLEVMIEFVEAGALDPFDHAAVIEAAEMAGEMLGV